MDRPSNRPARLCALAGALAALSLASPALADDWDAPSFYYSGITATSGAALKAQLHDLIDNHRSISYGSTISLFYFTEQDPDNPNNMILIYNGQSIPKQWDQGATWNREHTWPRSRGIDSSGPDNTDVHMLRPCNSGVNGSRSNQPFGEGGSFWDPNSLGAKDRGEIARAMFYAATRYEGQESGTTDLELVNGFPSGNNMGDLAALLRWHFEEMPDERERFRNHYIYDSTLNPLRYQGNRNPFIDHPEYVWAIWGDQPNNSTITISGQQAQAGSSSLSVDAGMVIAGGTLEWPIALTKIGSTPTTYLVTVSGDATVTGIDSVTGDTINIDGIPRSFPYNNANGTFTVSIDGSQVGPAAATVTIDNTDLTSSGSGRGSADGDDTVTVSATVVAPSQPSLDGASIVTSEAVDLGQIERLSGDAIVSRLVTNLPQSQWQATARFDGADVSAGPGVSVAWAGPVDVDAGDAAPLTVLIDTASPLGVVNAVITIPAADAPSVAGAEPRGELTLTVTAELVPQVPAGDLDNDDTVGTSDLLLVLAGWGTSDGSADADGDGYVGTADLLALLGSWGVTAN